MQLYNNKKYLQEVLLMIRPTVFSLLVLVFSICGPSCIVFAQSSIKDSTRMGLPTVNKYWKTVINYTSKEKKNINELPVRTNIKKSVTLGVHNLNVQFDRDRNNEPYFYCLRRNDSTGEMKHAVEIGIPHVVGRSMLGSEMADWKMGITFPADGFKIYEKYARMSFDNPDHLNSFYKDGERGVELHNMREGLWSLWALLKADKTSWARDKARKMLETLHKMSDTTGMWKNELIKKYVSVPVTGASVDNQARMIEPLIAYFMETQDTLALSLARQYSKLGVTQLLDSTGRITPFGKSSGHIHSITSSISGIAQYAVMVNDTSLINRCVQFFKNGLQEYFSSWGWGDEVMPDHPANVVSQGEINQTGDVIRAALYLAEYGKTELYEVAERYLRSSLLPAQVWPEDLKGFLKENKDPKNDSEKDILNRCKGGYGFPLPNARMKTGDYPVETQDITSGAVHSLVTCWTHILTRKNGNQQLNLLFDAENESVSVKSHLPKLGSIEISAKTDVQFMVRIPEWVDRRSIVIKLNSKKIKNVFQGDYLSISDLRQGDKALIKFDVPCKTESERVDGTTYVTTWIGNQLIAIDPKGTLSRLPF